MSYWYIGYSPSRNIPDGGNKSIWSRMEVEKAHFTNTNTNTNSFFSSCSRDGHTLPVVGYSVLRLPLHLCVRAIRDRFLVSSDIACVCKTVRAVCVRICSCMAIRRVIPVKGVENIAMPQSRNPREKISLDDSAETFDEPHGRFSIFSAFIGDRLTNSGGNNDVGGDRAKRKTPDQMLSRFFSEKRGLKTDA